MKREQDYNETMMRLFDRHAARCQREGKTVDAAWFDKKANEYAGKVTVRGRGT